MDLIPETDTVAGWRRSVASVASVLECPITARLPSQTIVPPEPTTRHIVGVASEGFYSRDYGHVAQETYVADNYGVPLPRTRSRHHPRRFPSTPNSSPHELPTLEVQETHSTAYETTTSSLLERAIPPSPGGFVSDGTDALTDSETLLEERDGRSISVGNRGPATVISATGWARVSPTVWDSQPNSPARNPRRLQHRSPRHSQDDADTDKRPPPQARPAEEQQYTMTRSPEQMPVGAESRRSTLSSTHTMRDPSRRGSHASVRFSLRHESLPAGNLAQPPSQAQAPDGSASSSPPGDYNTSPPAGYPAASPPWWMPSPLSTTTQWVPNAQAAPHVSPFHARMAHPMWQAPPIYVPPTSYPGMPPYAYHANWSYPELYRDMATAAGLGMGTPFRNPHMPLAPSGPVHQATPNGPTNASSPTGPGDGSVIGRILDTMVTPPSDPRSLHRDIEQTLPNAPSIEKAHGWKPTWVVFPLKAFRGIECHVIEVQCTWDDEKLLVALRRAYKELCGWHRGCLSLKELSHATRVGANDVFVYPQRIGPGRTTTHRNLRLRYLLEHPDHVRGDHAFMRALTESPEFGVEFVERWNMAVVSVVVLGSALLSLSIAFTYGWLSGDWPNGFTIASFFSQTFAQIFVLVGILQYYEF